MVTSLRDMRVGYWLVPSEAMMSREAGEEV